MLDEDHANYWNELSEEYQKTNRISTDDFHYGPLLGGEQEFNLIPNIKGKKCLELGCGGAQNSFYLASRGGICSAVDISQEQLDYAKKLGQELNLSVEFIQSSLDEFDFEKYGKFDFIHSTWSFPFSFDQERLVHLCARALNKGGTLLITTGHPVFAGEWITLDEYEEGIFLTDYFTPPADTRFTENEEKFIRAEKIPLGEFTSWILEADLELKALVEPQPQPIHQMSEEQIAQKIPYDAQAWREIYPQMSKIPFVVIYKAIKK